METVTLSGQDTVKINDRILNDLADGDAVMIEFPNDIAAVKVGKNGNALFSLNESGKQGDVTLRVMRGSSDDKFIQNLLSAQQLDFASFNLMSGEFTKRLGDGAGNITLDNYIMSGGIHSKPVAGKSNVEGDTGQGVSEYKLKFSKALRVLT